MNTEDYINKICDDAKIELKRALELHKEDKVTMVALMEEVGEYAKAALHLTEKADGTIATQIKLRQDVYEEGIQSIAMLLRLLSRGDESLGYKGQYCTFAGCKQNHIGGPCAICYE